MSAHITPPSVTPSECGCTVNALVWAWVAPGSQATNVPGFVGIQSTALLGGGTWATGIEASACPSPQLFSPLSTQAL